MWRENRGGRPWEKKLDKKACGRLRPVGAAGSLCSISTVVISSMLVWMLPEAPSSVNVGDSCILEGTGRPRAQDETALPFGPLVRLFLRVSTPLVFQVENERSAEYLVRSAGRLKDCQFH